MLESPAVAAALSATSIAYSPDTLSEPTTLTIGFTNSAQMAPGDSIDLSLPGFTGPALPADGSIAAPMVVSHPAGTPGASGYVSATLSSWDLSARTLQLVLALSVPASEAVEVSITVAAAITLPSTSLGADNTLGPGQTALEMGSTDAHAGWDSIALVAIAQTQAVAAALSGTSLSYAPAVLNTHTRVAVAFTNTAATFVGDSVGVKLTGFTGTPLGSIQASMMTEPGVGAALVSAANSAWDQTTKVLTLTLGLDVPAFTLVQVSVLATAQIRLPTTSLAVNQAALLVSFTDADSGWDTIADMAIEQSAAVAPILTTTMLTFSASTLNTQTAIILHFTNSAAMAVGDSVAISLPGFTGPNLAATQVVDSMLTSAPGYFDADASSWDLGSRSLALVLNGAVPASEAVTVTVTGAASLTLPTTSVYADTPALQITFTDNAPSGWDNVGPVSIEQSQAVLAALSSTSLQYSATVLNEVSFLPRDIRPLLPA